VIGHTQIIECFHVLNLASTPLATFMRRTFGTTALPPRHPIRRDVRAISIRRTLSPRHANRESHQPVRSTPQGLLFLNKFQL